ncbi:MAG TPA: hypothetical protein V6D29_02750 [Leptolyngbyaceae cyanobacterium]
MPASLVTNTSVECPKCGKHSIVYEDDAYQCLNCNFKREFMDKPTDDEASLLPMLFGILTFVSVLILFL